MIQIEKLFPWRLRMAAASSKYCTPFLGINCPTNSKTGRGEWGGETLGEGMPGSGGTRYGLQMIFSRGTFKVFCKYSRAAIVFAKNLSILELMKILYQRFNLVSIGYLPSFKSI